MVFCLCFLTKNSQCVFFSYSEYLSDSGKFKHKPYTTKSKKIHMQLIYNIYMYKKGKKILWTKFWTDYYIFLTGPNWVHFSSWHSSINTHMSCIHNIHINIEISHCISGEHIKMLRFTMALRSMWQCPWQEQVWPWWKHLHTHYEGVILLHTALDARNKHTVKKIVTHSNGRTLLSNSMIMFLFIFFFKY